MHTFTFLYKPIYIVEHSACIVINTELNTAIELGRHEARMSDSGASTSTSITPPLGRQLCKENTIRVFSTIETA